MLHVSVNQVYQEAVKSHTVECMPTRETQTLGFFQQRYQRPWPVYLRVHYVSDVIAGYCVGLMWLIIVISVLRRIESFSRRKVEPVLEKAA